MVSKHKLLQYIVRFRNGFGLPDFDVNPNLPVCTDPLGAKPDHVEQAHHFFKRVQPGSPGEKCKLVVPYKYDGFRVKVVFGVGKVISVRCAKSEKILEGFSQALQEYRDCFFPAMFGETYIFAEAVAYVRLALGEELQDLCGATFQPFDQNEVGYIGVTRADSLWRQWKKLYPERECPIELRLHCFALGDFCHNENPKHVVFSGSQITTMKDEMDFIRKLLGNCLIMEIVNPRPFTIDHEGIITGKDMDFMERKFLSYKDFTEFLLEQSSINKREGYVVCVDDRTKLSIDSVFVKPKDTNKATRCRWQLKVKNEFSLIVAAVIDSESGSKTCFLYCIVRGRNRKVFQFPEVPALLKEERVGIIRIIQVRCTFIHSNGTLVGVKAPWKSHLKGYVEVLSDARTYLSVIEDCLKQVPHWGETQKQKERLDSIYHNMTNKNFVEQMPLKQDKFSGYKRVASDEEEGYISPAEEQPFYFQYEGQDYYSL